MGNKASSRKITKEEVRKITTAESAPVLLLDKLINLSPPMLITITYPIFLQNSRIYFETIHSFIVNTYYVLFFIATLIVIGFILELIISELKKWPLLITKADMTFFKINKLYFILSFIYFFLMALFVNLNIFLNNPNCAFMQGSNFGELRSFMNTYKLNGISLCLFLLCIASEVFLVNIVQLFRFYQRIRYSRNLELDSKKIGKL